MAVTVHWTDVDGVTVAWTEGSPPITAALLFRTGTADEHLFTSGTTHLVEHLALSTIPDALDRRNGFVGSVVTGFVAKGSPTEVSDFVLRVCRALMALPGDRLEAEKQVLTAEAARRRHDLTASLLAWRYGAVSWGLAGVPPVGYRVATIDQLQSLATQRFTRQNAVLWLSGPPPADLRFDLPEGSKLAVPALGCLLPDLPAWMVDDTCGGVAVGATAPRVRASTVFTSLAARRLRERLRRDLAVSYSPAVGYEPLDAGTAHVVLFADSDAERRAELAEAFTEVLAGLDKVDEDELHEVRGEILDHWTGSLAPTPEQQTLHELQRAAMDWALGREFMTLEALVDDLHATGAPEVADFARIVQADALFALPSGVKLQPHMGSRAPVCLVPPVEGRRVRSVDAPLTKQTLVVGREGVTALNANRTSCTVRYSNLGAALTYEDGGLRLIGTDGAALSIEPTLWRKGPAVRDEIRGHVPSHLLLNQGARPAEAIPRPTTTRGQRFLGGVRVKTLLAMIAVCFGSLMAVVAVLTVTGDENLAGATFVVCLALVIVGNTVVTLRGQRRKGIGYKDWIARLTRPAP